MLAADDRQLQCLCCSVEMLVPSASSFGTGGPKVVEPPAGSNTAQMTPALLIAILAARTTDGCIGDRSVSVGPDIPVWGASVKPGLDHLTFFRSQNTTPNAAKPSGYGKPGYFNTNPTCV